VINLDQTLNIKLFEKALINNRPVFIDYFLRKEYNILPTSDFIELKNDSKHGTIKILNTKFNLFSSNNNQEKDLENENRSSTIDDPLLKYQLEEDDANVRALFARKFLIEKLYQKKINHLEVISISSFILLKYFCSLILINRFLFLYV
jgi:hypothetical protein